MSMVYTCTRCLLRQGSRRLFTSHLNDLHKAPLQRFRVSPAIPTHQSRLHTKPPTRASDPFDWITPDTSGLVNAAAYRNETILKDEELLHSYTDSPSPEIRKRAAFIKNHAYCPHPSHHQTRLATSPDDLESRKTQGTTTQPPANVKFECPDCKMPVYCCEEHWADDYEMHLEVCDTLRQINIDDHDLRSGRTFHEFQMPGPHQIEEAMINLSNWDVFLYTREFPAMNEPRLLRQATALLTYPVTIGSVLHEFSPYDLRKTGRTTTEGLKSFTALRVNVHREKRGEGHDIKGLRLTPPPVRIFVLGARAESSLPRNAWVQLAYMFNRAQFHVIFIGPEAMANRDSEYPLPERTAWNPFGEIIEADFCHDMKISTYVDYFHTIHKTGHFAPYDPYLDCFVLFHPGLGHPASSHEWEETLPLLLQTKCPIIVTGYTEWDMRRDIDWVDKKMNGEYDLLIRPGENVFRSLRWDLNQQDPSDVSCGNWGVWAFRGKRYEATTKDSPDGT